MTVGRRLVLVLVLVLVVVCAAASAAEVELPPTSVGATAVALPFAVRGPFAVGKGEVDARAEFLNFSDHAGGGRSSLFLARPGGDGFATVDFESVDWESLSAVGRREVLEWQASAWTEFSTTSERTALRCSGVASFRVGGRLFAGDVYPRGGGLFLDGFAVVVGAGTHLLTTRLRAARRGRLRCVAQRLPTTPPPAFRLEPLFAPDWLRHEGLVGHFASAVVTAPSWLRRLHVVKSRSPRFVKFALVDEDVVVAPGQRFSLRFKLEALPQATDPCLDHHFLEERLFLVGAVSSSSSSDDDDDDDKDSSSATASTTMRFECRRRSQSVVATFLDADGSVQRAAVLEPLKSSKSSSFFASVEARGVVLALHGTSVSPRDMADAFKQKKQGINDYEFGVEGAYVVAPSRHGAHNWEGVGLRTAVAALSAIEARLSSARLSSARLPQASKIVIVGHSMGAHGALLLASSLAFDGRVVAVAAVAPWSSKSSYGDSNSRFVLDARVDGVDPLLRAVLDASLAEQDVDPHLAQLCSLKKVLLRVGADDRAVSPWFARRTRRLLADLCKDVIVYEEVPAKDHWWWDTDQPNDGGCVNDDTMRRFYADALDDESRAKRNSSAKQQQREALVVSNPSAIFGPTPSGYRILQQIVPFVRRSSLDVDGDALRTRNARRIQLPSSSSLGGGGGGGSSSKNTKTLVVDGDVVLVDSSSTESLCLGETSWHPCEDSDAENAETERSPASHGPARQVVQGEFVLVVAKRHTDLAVFVSNQFLTTGHARAPIVVVDAPRSWEASVLGKKKHKKRNVVFVGLPPDWALVNTTAALEVGPRLIRVGGCEWRHPDAAVIALLPIFEEGFGLRLGLLLHGNSDAALRVLVETFATPTIPPMARQPFSSDVPDVVVLDARRTEREGVPGYDLAGYWDARWALSPQATWVGGGARCRPRLDLDLDGEVPPPSWLQQQPPHSDSDSDSEKRTSLNNDEEVCKEDRCE